MIAASGAGKAAGGAGRDPNVRAKYHNIQFLRFVAAFAVVVTHCTFYTFERLDRSMYVYETGAAGVRLFFVISGLVMMLSSGKLVGQAGGWRNFAVRRVNRIVPLYWAATLFKVLVLLLTPAVALHSSFDWDAIVKSLLFIPDLNVEGEFRPVLGVGWTLNFEMFFYALFGLALSTGVKPIRFMAPILLILSALSLVTSPAMPEVLRFWCDPIVLDFLAGMLIAGWIRRGGSVPETAAWLIGACGLAYLFVPGLPRPGASAALLASLLTTCAAAAVIVAAMALEGRTGKYVPGPVLHLGAASYSLYLVHPLVAPAVPQVLGKLELIWPQVSVALSVLAAVIAALFAYRFVEAPLSDAADRIGRRRGWLDAGPPSAADSAAATLLRR